MKLEDISVSIECEIIAKNDETKFYFDRDNFVVQFLFPIISNVGMLLDKISNYFISQHSENSKLISTDVRFQLYYIELYENDFKKAMEDFKKIISLDVSSDVLKEVIIKSFFNLLDISIKSYDKACAYLDRLHLTYDRFEGTFTPVFEGTFRQYCGLK